MRMNRRNVLVGLGGIVAGGGALLGTGAFSSVEATRDVDLNTTGDESALLSLEDGGSELVSVDEDDMLEISSEELNKNALTTADDAIDVTNNGENAVGFYVEGEEEDFDVLDFEVDGNSIIGEDGAVDLNENEGSTSVDLRIDLTSHDVEDIAENVTFVADTGAYDDE